MINWLLLAADCEGLLRTREEAGLGRRDGVLSDGVFDDDGLERAGLMACLRMVGTCICN